MNKPAQPSESHSRRTPRRHQRDEKDALLDQATQETFETISLDEYAGKMARLREHVDEIDIAERTARQDRLIKASIRSLLQRNQPATLANTDPVSIITAIQTNLEGMRDRGHLDRDLGMPHKGRSGGRS